MKLDIDLFPIGMVELMDKKVLVRTDQAEATKGKNVVVSDCNTPGVTVAATVHLQYFYNVSTVVSTVES
jgi:hypothetical protein